METDHQVRLPRDAEIQLSKHVQKEADKTGTEITSEKIWSIFTENFLLDKPFKLISFESKASSRGSGLEIISAEIECKNKKVKITSEGNGPISAFVNGMRDNFNLTFKLKILAKTLSATSKAEAAHM